MHGHLCGEIKTGKIEDSPSRKENRLFNRGTTTVKGVGFIHGLSIHTHTISESPGGGQGWIFGLN